MFGASSELASVMEFGLTRPKFWATQTEADPEGMVGVEERRPWGRGLGGA